MRNWARRGGCRAIVAFWAYEMTLFAGEFFQQEGAQKITTTLLLGVRFVSLHEVFSLWNAMAKYLQQ